MKGFKKIFFRIFISLILTVTFSIISCGSDDAEQFFKKYSYAAEISKVTFSGEHKLGYSGAENISSGEDYKIFFDIKNPKKLELEADVSFDEKSPASGGGYEKDFDEEHGRITLTFSNSLLENAAASISNDISPTITLKRKSTEELEDAKSIEDIFTLKLKCNNPPSNITNAMGQMYSNASFKERLVIAFDMPLIDNDTDRLYIEAKGKKHEFKIVEGIPQNETKGWEITSIKPENLKATYDGGDDFSSIGGTTYYILTDIYNTRTTSPFFITLWLLDNEGISSIPLKIESHKLKLFDISSNIQNEMNQDNGELFTTIKLEPPENSRDARIFYEFTETTTNEKITGNGNGRQIVKLYPGTYSVNAHAEKSGYVNSNEYEFTNFTIKKKKLEKVVTNIDSEALPQNEDGTFTLKLTSPDPKATIEYTVNKLGSSGTKILFTSGEKAGSVSIALYGGKFEVTAIAKREYCEDSDETSESLTASRNIVFVNAVTGSDIVTETTGWGTKDKPYKTISQAILDFKEQANTTGKTIYLQTNVTESIDINIPQVIMIASSDYNSQRILTGNGGSTITVSNSDASLTIARLKVTGGNAVKGGGIFVRNGHLTLSYNSEVSWNTASTDGGGIFISNGGGISINGKTNVSSNKLGNGTTPSNLKIESTLTKIKINGSIKGSNIGISVGGTIEFGSPVTFTSGFGASNKGLPSEVFKLDNKTEEFSIGMANGEGIFRVGQGTFSPIFKDKVIIQTLSSSVVPGGTITFQALDKDGKIIESGIQWQAELIYNGTSPTGEKFTSTSSMVTIPIPEAPKSGFYDLEVTVVYDGFVDNTTIQLPID